MGLGILRPNLAGEVMLRKQSDLCRKPDAGAELSWPGRINSPNILLQRVWLSLQGRQQQHKSYGMWVRIYNVVDTALCTSYLGLGTAFWMLPFGWLVFSLPKNEGGRWHHGELPVCCGRQQLLLHTQHLPSGAVLPTS